MEGSFIANIALIQTEQQSYGSDAPWTKFQQDFGNAQSSLIKDTLTNYFLSRGLKHQANKIHMDSDLDLKDEKVMSLLGKDKNEDLRLHELIDQKVEYLIHKNSILVHDREIANLRSLEKSVDQKLTHLHQTLKTEVGQAKTNHGVPKEEVVRLIKEARVIFKDDTKKYVDARFPNGFDPELESIINKKGNLTDSEIFKNF